MGLSSLFGPGSKVILPNLSGGINGANPVAPAPAPIMPTMASAGTNLGNPSGRTPLDQILGTETGAALQGNELGPQTNTGPSSELASHTGFSGSYGPADYTGAVPGQSTPVSLYQMFNPVTGRLDMPPTWSQPTQAPAESWWNGEANQPGGPPKPPSITQLQPFKQTAPATLIKSAQGPSPTPKPPEPAHTYATEGEWGGGSWYAPNAPAGMQPTWLQSYNGGNTWSTAANQPKAAPGTVPTQAPQGNWSTLNQGAAPQWIQR